MRNRDRQPISRKWHLGYFNKKKINACNAVNKKELSVKAINQLQIEQDNSLKELIEFSKEMENKGELKHKLLTEEDWANGVKFYPGCDNEGLILHFDNHGQLVPFYLNSEGGYIIPIDTDGIDWDSHWADIFEADTERMFKELMSD